MKFYIFILYGVAGNIEHYALFATLLTVCLLDTKKISPRRSRSPIYVDQDELDTLTENEMKQIEKSLMISVDDNGSNGQLVLPTTISTGTVLPRLRVHIYEKNREKLENKTLLERNNLLKYSTETASRRARIAEFILGFRSLLDFYERTHFPDWLREYVSDHTLRWRIMFKIEGNHFVEIVKLRIRNSKIREEDFFVGLDLYRTKMNVEHHEGDTPVIQSEEEWIEIFTRLNIKDYPHKECLRILSRAISKEENDSTWSTQRSEKSVPAALYMKGLPFHYNKEDVKKFLIGVEGDQSIVTDVTVLLKEATNKKMKSTGEAIVLIGSIKDALLIYGKKNDYMFPASKLIINMPYTLE